LLTDRQLSPRQQHRLDLVEELFTVRHAACAMHQLPQSAQQVTCCWKPNQATRLSSTVLSCGPSQQATVPRQRRPLIALDTVEPCTSHVSSSNGESGYAKVADLPPACSRRMEAVSCHGGAKGRWEPPDAPTIESISSWCLQTTQTHASTDKRLHHASVHVLAHQSDGTAPQMEAAEAWRSASTDPCACCCCAGSNPKLWCSSSPNAPGPQCCSCRLDPLAAGH